MDAGRWSTQIDRARSLAEAGQVAIRRGSGRPNTAASVPTAVGGAVWSAVVRWGPPWSAVVRRGPPWSAVVRSGPPWSGVVWSGGTRHECITPGAEQDGGAAGGAVKWSCSRHGRGSCASSAVTVRHTGAAGAASGAEAVTAAPAPAAAAAAVTYSSLHAALHTGEQ